MAGAALLGRLNWRVCTLVDATWETPCVRSLVFDCPDWPGHLPGQHVDVRLTAEDGYQPERSYSISNPADDGRITPTVQRLDDGEVSPYLCDELVWGDRLELRGPIGGYFVRRPDILSPALLVAGGSGIVPLMAMVRGRDPASGNAPMRLRVSDRQECDDEG